MNCERLIESVQRHEFLYDTNHRDYKNLALKAATWEIIGKELDSTGEAARSKWKTLRDGYTKYKKVIKSMCGSKKHGQYVWAEHLSFLDDVGHGPRSPGSPQHSQYPCLDNYHDAALSSTPPLQVTLSELASRLPTSPDVTSRRRKDIDIDLTGPNKRKRNNFDGIDHLFLSYADTFKKFPLRDQALIKLELAKLFTNTELRLLHNHPNPETLSEEARAQYALKIESDQMITYYSNE